MFKKAWPYADDALNLPVKNLDDALPFYETVMGFQVVSRKETTWKSAVLGRDGIQIGLAENGGDPSQEGCFFEVDDVEAAFAELKARGLNKEEAGFRVDRYGETSYRVFFSCDIPFSTSKGIFVARNYLSYSATVILQTLANGYPYGFDIMDGSRCF